jgi:hypothetical protein
VTAVVDRDLVADRLPFSPVPLGEAATDDRRNAGRITIAVAKDAATQQWHTDNLEVVRADARDVGRRRLSSRLQRATPDQERLQPWDAGVVEWEIARDRGPRHARLRRHPLRERIRELEHERP